MAGEDTDRDHGIEFGDLEAEMESVDYPITNEEFVERFGDRTIGISGGEVTVAETLGPLGDTTHESADEVHDAVLNMVGDGAVGREGYSDRGPAKHHESAGEEERESF